MRVFHGSPHRFDTFSFDYVGTNGTSEGMGIYFTDNESIARGYSQEGGYLYVVDFKGRKELSYDTVTMTRDDLARVMTEMDRRNEYLSNYGDVSYEGFNAVLNTALDAEFDYSESDVDIMCSIANGSGSLKDTLDVFYTLLGYDHFTTVAEWGNEQTLYIAMTTDAFDIVSIENV